MTEPAAPAIVGDALYLSFPQWQGAGSRTAIDRSCEQLPAELPEYPWEAVPVATRGRCTPDRGIRGRNTLLRQLRRANDIMRARSPRTIFLLGGDCSIELAPVSHLNSVGGGRLGVLWLDAHPDLSTPSNSLTANLHGMVLTTLFGEGDPDFVAELSSRLEPSQVVLAGARDIDPHEWPELERLGMPILPCAQIENDPRIIRDVLLARQFDRVFIHLDLDVLDPRRFPSVAFPTPGGLDPTSILSALRLVRDSLTVAGFGITEYFERRAGDRNFVRAVAGTLLAGRGCPAPS